MLIDHQLAGDEKDRSNLPSAKELLELEKQGQLDRVLRVRLSSVEQNRAMVQFGERVPVATGRSVGGFGRGGAAADGRPVSISYSLENIGTLISATTRVEDSGTVVADLQVERSQMAAIARPAEDVPDAVGRQKTVSLTSQTTLRLKPGEPTLAKASRFTADGETTGQFIVVTATVDTAGAEQAAARGGNANLVRAFALQNAQAKTAHRVLADVFGDKPMRIGVDEAQNTVIVAGAREELEEVERLLQVLDQGAVK